jgi:hypothetical protein
MALPPSSGAYFLTAPKSFFFVQSSSLDQATSASAKTEGLTFSTFPNTS